MKQASRIIISNENNQVLLGKRTGGVESGKWSIFGGKPDEGETPEQTALREVFEETGLHLSTLTFLFTDHFKDWISHYFEALLQEENEWNLTEHNEIRFFSWDELQKIENEIAFNHYLILKKYFEL